MTQGVWSGPSSDSSDFVKRLKQLILNNSQRTADLQLGLVTKSCNSSDAVNPLSSKDCTGPLSGQLYLVNNRNGSLTKVAPIRTSTVPGAIAPVIVSASTFEVPPTTPAEPPVLAIVINGAAFDLSWTQPTAPSWRNASPNPPSYLYSLYRSTSPIDITPYSGQLGTLVYSGVDLTFEDTGITPGVTYYYVVAAQSDWIQAAFGMYSNIVSSALPDAIGYADIYGNRYDLSGNYVATDVTAAVADYTYYSWPQAEIAEEAASRLLAWLKGDCAYNMGATDISAQTINGAEIAPSAGVFGGGWLVPKFTSPVHGSEVINGPPGGWTGTPFLRAASAEVGVFPWGLVIESPWDWDVSVSRMAAVVVTGDTTLTASNVTGPSGLLKIIVDTSVAVTVSFGTGFSGVSDFTLPARDSSRPDLPVAGVMQFGESGGAFTPVFAVVITVIGNGNPGVNGNPWNCTNAARGRVGTYSEDLVLSTDRAAVTLAAPIDGGTLGFEYHLALTVRDAADLSPLFHDGAANLLEAHPTMDLRGNQGIHIFPASDGDWWVAPAYYGIDTGGTIEAWKIHWDGAALSHTASVTITLQTPGDYDQMLLREVVEGE